MSSVLSNEEKASEVVKKFLGQFPWYSVVIRDVVSSVLTNEVKVFGSRQEELGSVSRVYCCLLYVYRARGTLAVDWYVDRLSL